MRILNKLVILIPLVIVVSMILYLIIAKPQKTSSQNLTQMCNTFTTNLKYNDIHQEVYEIKRYFDVIFGPLGFVFDQSINYGEELELMVFIYKAIFADDILYSNPARKEESLSNGDWDFETRMHALKMIGCEQIVIRDFLIKQFSWVDKISILNTVSAQQEPLYKRLSRTLGKVFSGDSEKIGDYSQVSLKQNYTGRTYTTFDNTFERNGPTLPSVFVFRYTKKQDEGGGYLSLVNGGALFYIPRLKTNVGVCGPKN